jgi:hypothetical protein
MKYHSLMDKSMHSGAEPVVLPTSERIIKIGQNNSRATNALLNRVDESVYTKFIHYKYSKEIWNKL